MRRLQRRRGFTLVEILISLGLAGLIVAGAFQLNNSFSQQARRQNQIADVQQSLRLVMNILEHSIRSAGSGLSGNLMRFTGCSTTDLYGFQYYNTNTFPPVAGTFDTNAGDNDPDPDWFRVLVPEPGQYLITADTGSASTILGGPLTDWAAGNLFVALQPGSQTLSCVREVSSVAPSSNTVVHNSPGSQFPCANPALETVASGPADLVTCGLAGIAANPVPVRRFATETIYRIWTPAAGSLDPPKLVMARPPINHLTNVTWTVVAENIEDMQIALIMKNGSICNHVDSPTLCNPTAISAVRVTLVGRSTTTIQGLASGKTGGYEDRAEVATTDGYLRRSLTAVIQLRN